MAQPDPDETLIHHRVDEWAVGHLRLALAGVPDHLPVRVLVAEAPGGDIAAIQIVYDADVVDRAALGAGRGPAHRYGSRSAVSTPATSTRQTEHSAGLFDRVPGRCSADSS